MKRLRFVGVLWDDEAFSGLLRSRDLSIWKDASGLARCITTDGFAPGRWKPHIRTINLSSGAYECGAKTIIKEPDSDTQWETANVIVEFEPDWYVAFYTASTTGNRYGRVATASSMSGPFTRIPGIQVRPTWTPSSHRFEFDPGAHIASDDGTTCDLKILGSVQPDFSGGQSGWFDFRVDSQSRTVQYLGESQPVAALDAGGDCRTGGAMPLEIGGLMSAFMTNKAAGKYEIWHFRSIDPLFGSASSQRIVDDLPRIPDNWKVWQANKVEKYTAYLRDTSTLSLLINTEFSEGGVSNGEWGLTVMEFDPEWQLSNEDAPWGDANYRIRNGLVEQKTSG